MKIYHLSFIKINIVLFLDKDSLGDADIMGIK